MKHPNLFSKSKIQPTLIGLSEDKERYCLVKNEAGNLSLFWHSKQTELASLLEQAPHFKLGHFYPQTNKLNRTFLIVRPIAHSYIWRKTVFLSKSLDDTQLRRKVLHILKNEQPLSLELLNFDYQTFQSNHPHLNKIVIYAVRKSYAEQFTEVPCILDCELHCYMRAISHFYHKQPIPEFPCFKFQHQIVQFSENNLQFLDTEPENCIHLPKIAAIESEMDLASQHLYFLALGASLWNGKGLI